MKLPIFNELLNNQSTYITFSKSLLDYDIANNENSEYYFSRMVALNLPNYKNPDFFLDLSSLGETNQNPNYVIPKGLQYYMENIIRQKTDTQNIVELAFYKFLNKCGLNYYDIRESIVFSNKINTENFTYVENNNGWGQIVMSIPNDSKYLIKTFKTTNIEDIILADLVNNNTDGLFDDNLPQKGFDFSDPSSKMVLDFDNFTYNDNTDYQFDFNCILVFYKDKYGIEKLHGINFINNFQNKITEWLLPRYTQKTNDARSIGYIFKMNVKTVNNEASLIQIENHQMGAEHWNTYFGVFTNFNTYLESHKQTQESISSFLTN